MIARALAAFALVAIAPAAAHGACPEPAVTGVQPCDDVLRPTMIGAGAGTLGAAGAPLRTMHAYLGAAAKVVPGWVPCVILSSVAATESSWHQFGYVACGQRAPTLISFDCGYGIGQITSGMDGSAGFSPSRVAADPVYNMSVSANFMISKWEYTAAVTPNDPKIAEDWYFALWGYNGLATKNNPNTHPETLGTYYNPDNPAYPRANYAYQEIVLGYALYPRKGPDGTPRWPSTRITHIDFSEICSACGNPGSSLVVSRPSSEHSGDCVAAGPDWAAQFVAQSFPPASKGAVTLQPGESAAAYVELKNVGLKTWNSNTKLATTEPRDRASAFAGSDWAAPNRPAAVTGTVAPGGTYRFSFTFKAPPAQAPGDYAEFFGVVQEGTAWFSDPPENQIQAKVTVVPPAASDAGAAPSDAGPADRRDGGPTPRADAAATAGDSGAPGSVDGGETSDPSLVGAGCGCASGQGLDRFRPLALLALVLARRRRRATAR